MCRVADELRGLFGAIGAFVPAGNLTPPLLGGILLMAAVIIAQLPKDFLIRIASLIRK